MQGREQQAEVVAVGCIPLQGRGKQAEVAVGWEVWGRGQLQQTEEVVKGQGQQVEVAELALLAVLGQWRWQVVGHQEQRWERLLQVQL